jgi:hypothetical protein
VNEHRYFDSFAADGYYLSDRVKDVRGRRPTIREELNQPSCPACYTPLKKQAYCARCTTSGAAETHARRHRKVKLVTVKPPTKPVSRVTGLPMIPRRTPEQRRERFILAIQSYMAETGAIPTQMAWRRSKRVPSFSEAYSVFESWGDLLQAAGIETRR